MNKIIRIGIDTSKRIFVVHEVDAAERPVLRKKLRRSQVLDFFRALQATKIGIEACGSAHHWARELAALGHEVVLLPPQYIKPYVKRNKNDAADAEVICEAMARPTMRFVPVKTKEQQAALMLAGTRDALIRRRTQVSNAIRGYAAEFGLVTAKGLNHVEPLLARIAGRGGVAGSCQGAVRGPGRGICPRRRPYRRARSPADGLAQAQRAEPAPGRGGPPSGRPAPSC